MSRCTHLNIAGTPLHQYNEILREVLCNFTEICKHIYIRSEDITSSKYTIVCSWDYGGPLTPAFIPIMVKVVTMISI
jgi:hypothetical protein